MAPTRVILNKEERIQLMRQCHDGGAHFATQSCFNTLKTKVYWSSMFQDLKKWIGSCEICQSVGSPRPQTTVIQIPTQRLFQRFAFDYVGPLNVTPAGNRYIFVGTEYYSKSPIAVPTQSIDAVTTARLIYSHVICQFGIPEIILTDQAMSFRSKLVEKLCKIMKMRHHMSTPYHPQCNGLVERFNQTLCIALTKLGQVDNWDWYVEQILMIYRMRQHSDTELSPFEILYEVKPRVPINDAQLDVIMQLRTRPAPPQSSPTNEVVSEFAYDDQVLLFRSELVNRFNTKLEHDWAGPFAVCQIGPNNTYKLRSPMKPCPRLSSTVQD